MKTEAMNLKERREGGTVKVLRKEREERIAVLKI